MKKNDICFLICTEKGYLETQSILLCKSIRGFGENFKNAPIYSFAPRKGFTPSRKTIQILESLKVEHKNIFLNLKYHDYPYANKVLAAEYAQRNFNFDKFVFLDSDLINLNEPKKLNFSNDFSAAISPVHNTISASMGTRSRNESFWMKMYRNFEISNECFVQSVLEKKRIRAYWNTGVVSVRRSTEVFGIWREVMEKMFRYNVWPSTGMHFCEEISLTLTLLKYVPYKQIYQLPIEYNFPMYDYKNMKKKNRWKSAESVVFYHYMNLFEIFPYRSLEFLKAKKSNKMIWIRENLESFGLDVY